jgi:radical SAM superfamily enzyme YgiQ (UPF0313 family)
MANLAVETKELGFKLEQVQDFTPTPMTVATVIYYSGVHPYTLKPYDTVKKKEEKLNQRRFFFWYKRENHDHIRRTLKKANRPEMIEQLIGNSQSTSQNASASKRAKPSWLEERRKNDKTRSSRKKRR